jgi:hypothetical protein
MTNAPGAGFLAISLMAIMPFREAARVLIRGTALANERRPRKAAYGSLTNPAQPPECRSKGSLRGILHQYRTAA